MYLCYGRVSSYTPPSNWEGKAGPLPFLPGGRVVEFYPNNPCIPAGSTPPTSPSSARNEEEEDKEEDRTGEEQSKIEELNTLYTWVETMAGVEPQSRVALYTHTEHDTCAEYAGSKQGVQGGMHTRDNDTRKQKSQKRCCEWFR